MLNHPFVSLTLRPTPTGAEEWASVDLSPVGCSETAEFFVILRNRTFAHEWSLFAHWLVIILNSVVHGRLVFVCVLCYVVDLSKDFCKLKLLTSARTENGKYK